MKTKTYQEDLLDRLDALSERLDTITNQILNFAFEGEKQAVEYWKEIGDEIAMEMKTLILIHSALYEKE